MESAGAPLHPRCAGQIRRPRHQRVIGSGGGCGVEVVTALDCKFCHKQVPKLVNAHIIPRSLFRAALGQGKSFIHIEVNDADLDRKFKQTGISDKTILCEQCERFFSPYDTHGFEVVTNLLATKQIFYDTFGKSFAYISKVADYRLFKLFVLSVLWRASVSSLEFFDEIHLGAHEGKIRMMLKNNNAGIEDDYSVLCLYQTDHKYPSTVIPPFQQRIEGGINFCRLYLPLGLVFLIKVDSRPLPKNLLPWIVKQNSQTLFQLFPYSGSYEMQRVESVKVLTKKHLGIPLRTVYRYEKPNLD
ncbi:MAG: hypothetical protein ABSG80_02465 [Verrucomicrobiota bacterium]|jgi:hypothetical protein